MASRARLCRNLLSYSLKRFNQPSYCAVSSLYAVNNPAIQPKVWNCWTTSQNKIERWFHDELKHYSYQCVRYYAKSRDKKKSDKGHKKKVQINEETLGEVINVEVMRRQMQAAVEKLKEDFIKNLSLRSTSGSIEGLPITFEGKDYILQDLAQIVRKNPKTLVIHMAAFPQVIPTVIQVIAKSGMNLNPQQDGTTLFIPIPKVTKEHREGLSKNAKTLFIKCRDNIKDVQNKFVKTVKNKESDGLSKDTSQLVSDYIVFTATEYISAAEKVMEAKQQELLKEA